MNFSQKTQTWFKMVRNWIKMNGNGLKWMEMAGMVKLLIWPNRQKQPKQPKMAKNVQKWPKMVENSWSQIDIDGHE